MTGVSMATLQQWAAAFAVGIGIVWLGFIIQRFRTDEDPSVQYVSSTAAGSTSILISGVHVSLLLAGAIAALTWPLVRRQPRVLLVLVAGVAVHYLLEKREVEMN